MYREKKPYIGKLKCIYPKVFWYECSVCHNEFKREYGWRYSSYSDMEHVKYICNRCADTKEKAEQIVIEHKFTNYRTDYLLRMKNIPPPIPSQPPTIDDKGWIVKANKEIVE